MVLRYLQVFIQSTCLGTNNDDTALGIIVTLLASLCQLEDSEFKMEQTNAAFGAFVPLVESKVYAEKMSVGKCTAEP